jgi:hypothetical protein
MSFETPPPDDFSAFFESIVKDKTPKELEETKRQSYQNDVDTLLTQDNRINAYFEAHTKAYEKKSSQNKRLKAVLFYVCVVLMFLLVAGALAVICIAVLCGNETVLIAASAFGFVQITSAFIVIPKMIADYLFNKDEDARHMDLMKEILQHNTVRHQDVNKRT